VRQLNLYGFKKVKYNGKHRFTHAKLIKGDKYFFFYSDFLPSLQTKSIKLPKKTKNKLMVLFPSKISTKLYKKIKIKAQIQI